MYAWLKFAHVMAVVLFLGNIITGVFWHAHAARTRDPRLIAHAMDGIIRSDRFFTIPGVFFILAAGVAGAMAGGLPLLRTGWILYSIVLFSISGAVFVLRLAPLQRQLFTLATEGAERGTFDFPAYRRVARQWELWGALATATPIAAALLMTLKPTFGLP